jgi:hypothetical protein
VIAYPGANMKSDHNPLIGTFMFMRKTYKQVTYMIYPPKRYTKARDAERRT